MPKLQKSLLKLESNIDKQELINQKISKSSVGWHIEHSLLTINLIIDALKNSNPQNYKWKLNFPKLLVFTINKIPRGRGKSPGVVVPVTYNVESLRNHLEKTKIEIRKLNALNPNQYFEHPFFGNLKLNETIKFLWIHTNHHLAIINDIIKLQK